MDSEKQLIKLIQKIVKQNGKVEGIDLARRVNGFVRWDGISGVKLEKIYAMGIHINGEDIQLGYYKTITNMEKYYEQCDMEDFLMISLKIIVR